MGLPCWCASQKTQNTKKHVNPAGQPWKWACDAGKDDPEWTFTEEGDEQWTYVHDAGDTSERLGTATKTATGEAFRVRLQFARRYVDPGLEQRMSGGERGCAHSHLRMWRLAAETAEPTLVLEDDIQFCFTRSDSSLGEADGQAASWISSIFRVTQTSPSRTGAIKVMMRRRLLSLLNEGEGYCDDSDQ